MTHFDYSAFAELFPGKRPFRSPSDRYRRFDTAAEALRYAMEEMPRDLLRGSMLEVEEERFEAAQIDMLYHAKEYPLVRSAATS